MKTIREAKTMCPECARDIVGHVVHEGEEVYLDRNCPEHGVYRLPLSHNGARYADLDRFYFRLFQDQAPQGRITNYWVLITSGCQVKCGYCTLDLNHPFYDEMSLEDFRHAVKTAGKAKLTLSGGEPTTHVQLFAFFEEANRAGALVQLATNGVALASPEYCRRLADAKVAEVRVSIDSFDPEQTKLLGTQHFHDAKLQALDNLGALGLTTSLSPTIFKGINEDQLVQSLEYAYDKPFLRSLSVNGFSWVGGGTTLDKGNMMMPDEMMDLLYAHYAPAERDAGFVFQKVLLALMRVLRIRLCLYTQILIFVRDREGMRPITDFLNVKRLGKAIVWWERFISSGRLVQALALFPVLLSGLRFRTLRLAPACIRLLVANLFQIRISRYPSRLFPVILNTNCSTPNADAAVGVQCMSGNLYVQEGTLKTGFSSQSLLTKERDRKHHESSEDSTAPPGSSR